MRNSFLLFFLFLTGMGVNALWAQKKVSGTVWEKETNLPLIGVNILVKGTSVGTVTDLDGFYELQANPSDVLQFRFLGMNTMEETVGDQTVINVEMTSDAQKINEVVVTAMGIERKSKTLTYATQQVGGNELTRAKETNLVNSLQGKTSGLVITPNSSGAGGSAKILLRGNKSAQGNNQPLIVVDGVPMSNPRTTQLEGEYMGRDGGDALSNLNPDDIASINVLKGASAAALYGSMAANGVIMITTRKGREGSVRIDFGSNILFEKASTLPELQHRYGSAGSAASSQSWGDKITGEAKGKDRLDEFFRTGTSFINSISLNGGTEAAQTYVSYANTTSTGIEPTNDFQRHNMTAKQTLKAFDGKLTVDASINYILQKANNRPGGGTYFNPLPGLYTFPADQDFRYYKDNYELMDPMTNQPAQQWYTPLDDFTSNPFWVLNRNMSSEKRQHTIASASARYAFTSWLNIQGRLSLDNTNDYYEREMYATSSPVLVPANGRYQRQTFDAKQFYGDVMLNFSNTFNEWEINASLGSSFLDFKTDRTALDSDKVGLILPNYFVPENVAGNGMQRVERPRKRLNSVFATAQIGFGGMVYLDVTGRNDWSSTLAYTSNQSYFYPSFGLTALLNEMLPMEGINLLKLRGSYSIVGNDMPAYITKPKDGINLGSLEPNNNAPFSEMKPEKMHSMEFGFDLSMLDSRLDIDFTYYKTNNKNQYFSVSAPMATGYERYYINTGNIQNQGFESSVNWRTDFGADWSWRTNFNISYNENEVKELDPRLGKYVEIGSGAGFRFILQQGGAYGDIWTRTLQRNDDGSLVVDKENKNRPVISSDYEYVGNVNPNWQLGWGNNINYKDFSLYFLFDGRIGGNTVGMTQSYLDSFGVTEETAKARDNKGVDAGNGVKIDADVYYMAIAGKDRAGAEYVYSATNFRMRELSFGYTFRNLLGVSKNLTASLIGRNLFFLYKDSPHDPEMSMSTSNGYQGIDIFGLPATRSIGINLKATF